MDNNIQRSVDVGFAAGWLCPILLEAAARGLIEPGGRDLPALHERVASGRVHRCWERSLVDQDPLDFVRACQRRIGIFDFGGFLGAVVSADSVRSALAVIERYLELLSPALMVDSIVDRNVLLVRLRNTPILHWADQLLFVLLFLDTASQLLRRPAIVHGLLFNFPDPGFGDRLEGFSGAPVMFESGFTSLVLDAADVDRTIPTASSAVHHSQIALLEQELAARSSAISVRVHDVVQGMLDQGESPDAASVAERLAMSSRSLQRKLADSATTFSDILDEVRARRAQKLLITTRRPIAWIAHHSGFETQASFTRFFNRKVGMTPRSYRKIQGALG